MLSKDRQSRSQRYEMSWNHNVSQCNDVWVQVPNLGSGALDTDLTFKNDILETRVQKRVDWCSVLKVIIVKPFLYNLMISQTSWMLSQVKFNYICPFQKMSDQDCMILWIIICQQIGQPRGNWQAFRNIQPTKTESRRNR